MVVMDSKALTGIWPFNSDIFPDYLYEPAQTTNIALEDTSNERPHQQAALDNVSIAGSSAITTRKNNASETATQQADNTSQVPAANTDTSATNKQCSSSTVLAVPIEEISPAPKGRYISRQGKRKPKTRQTCLVLTSTLNMQEIKSKNEPKAPPANRRRKVTKRLLENDSEEENIPNNLQDDEEDCPCIYCNDLFSLSKPGEDWLHCLNCSHWAHASCADVPRKTKRFICELCQYNFYEYVILSIHNMSFCPLHKDKMVFSRSQ